MENQKLYQFNVTVIDGSVEIFSSYSLVNIIQYLQHFCAAKILMEDITVTYGGEPLFIYTIFYDVKAVI